MFHGSHSRPYHALRPAHASGSLASPRSPIRGRAGTDGTDKTRTHTTQDTGLANATRTDFGRWALSQRESPDRAARRQCGGLRVRDCAASSSTASQHTGCDELRMRDGSEERRRRLVDNSCCLLGGVLWLFECRLSDRSSSSSCSSIHRCAAVVDALVVLVGSCLAGVRKRPTGAVCAC